MIVGKINPYEYSQLAIPKKSDFPKIETFKYRFRNKRQVFYIVDVERYQYNLYAIKFYLKKHSGSPFKFSHMTKHGDARRVIQTCLKIGIEILDKNECASFCFIGAPLEKEFEEKEYDTSKRYRVYSRMARFLLSPETFEHTDLPLKSAYFLINKREKAKNPNLLSEITDMFDKHYSMDSIFPDILRIRQEQLTRSCRSDKKV
jgi:hypothetical protein